MEVGQIEAFLQVVRDGSFSRAADSLNLSQPSVSARVAGLEASLNCRLFKRSGRRLRLTPIGESFLPYAERAMTALQDGQRTVSDHQTGKRGQVSVVVLDTLAVSFLPEPLQRFRLENPQVDFNLHLCMPREILNLLYEGIADLGLIRGPLWDPGIEVLAHFQESIKAVAHRNHPLARLTEVSLAEVMDFPLFRIPSGPTTTAFIEHFTAQARAREGSSLISLPAIMAIPMLIKGDGIAFLPESFVREQLNRGELVVLKIAELPWLTQEPLLVKLTDRQLDEHHQTFVQMVRAQWRSLLVGS